jgi:hypothetical protein
MDPLKNLENIIEAEDNFFIKVRSLEGVDSEKLNELLTAINQLELFYSDKDLVPKHLFSLTVDMIPILFGMAETYPEPARSEVYLAIDKIESALTSCFQSSLNYRFNRRRP